MKIVNLVYPELSYRIVVILFEVHNQLGGGHQEKYYCHAIKESLKENKLNFKEQLKFPIMFNG